MAPETIFCSNSEQKLEQKMPRPRGRPPGRVPGSLRDIAARLGTNVSKIRRAQQHVDAVEKYPELEPLPRRTAVAAAWVLDQFPSERRIELRRPFCALDPKDRRRLGRRFLQDCWQAHLAERVS
jgi:hypothetical protein